MQLSIRASLAIHCLILVSEFGETDKITSEKIALSTGTNPVAIRSIMSALKKDGILNVKTVPVETDFKYAAGRNYSIQNLQCRETAVL